MSRVQYLLILIVFLARLCIPEINGDYSRGVTTLIFSCILSIWLGIMLIVSTKLWDKQPAQMTNMDIVMLENNLPRNRIGGRLAQSTEGWHCSGMVYDGWFVLGNMLCFGERYAVPIDDRVQPYLAWLICPSKFELVS